MGAETSTTQPAAPPAIPPQGGDPGPVPYERFAQVNQAKTSLEATNAQLTAQLAAAQQQAQQAQQQALANQAAQLGAERQLHVQLARAGVITDQYAEYLANQYKALGPSAPPVAQW